MPHNKASTFVSIHPQSVAIMIYCRIKVNTFENRTFRGRGKRSYPPRKPGLIVDYRCNDHDISFEFLLLI